MSTRISRQGKSKRKSKAPTKVRDTHGNRKRRRVTRQQPARARKSVKAGRAQPKKRSSNIGRTRVTAAKKRSADKRNKVAKSSPRPSSRRSATRKSVRRRVSWSAVFKLPGLTTIVDHSGDTNGRPLTKRRQRQFTDRDDSPRSTRKPATHSAKKKRKRKVPKVVRKKRAAKTKRK